MKRFTALLVTAVLLISMLGVLTAYAGASISGKSEVLAGKSYTYTGKFSCSGGDMVGKITGLGQTNSFDDKAGGLENGSLSGSASITVKIPSDAKPGDTYVITLSGSYSVMDSSGNPSDHSFKETKTIKVVTSTPSGSSGSGSTTSKTTKATAAPGEWDLAAASVGAMQMGGTLTVDITKDPKIPASLLSTVKEKQGKLTVNFGSYTCTIDGKTMGSLSEDAKSIDLSMKMNKDETFSSAVGGKDAYQLHFTYHGQLPGRFTYKFKAENSKPGDVLYLYYYYDQPGVCEGLQSATVDADGYVSFDIYHCSSYFVSAGIIEGAAGADFASGPESGQSLQEALEKQAVLETQLTDAQNTSKELQSQIDTLKSETMPANPLTADVSGPAGQLLGVPYVSLIAALLGAALVSMFLTMLICRVGVFRKRETAREKSDNIF